jgi:hypothetical protein
VVVSGVLGAVSGFVAWFLYEVAPTVANSGWYSVAAGAVIGIVVGVVAMRRLQRVDRG